MTETTLAVLVGIAVVIVLAVDLGVFQKSAHELSAKRALAWSIFWIVFSLVFNLIIYYNFGRTKAVLFLSGYLVEKSLSVDNLFVFLLIFSYFGVPQAYQHKVLFWGIAGAIIMRGILIYAGIQLIASFHWLIYLLGAFLVLTGIKTALKGDDTPDFEGKPFLRFLRRVLPLTPGYEQGQFFVKKNGAWKVTPLLVVLIFIETTDVLFALDSIPAILAITTDPFILYSSNLFAILGLRALYFILASLMQKFPYLSYGVSLILIFVGGRMLVSPWVDISEVVTLCVISGLLLLSALASLRKPVPASPEEPHKN